MPPNSIPKVASYWDRTQSPTPDETDFWVDSPLEQTRAVPAPGKTTVHQTHRLNEPPPNGRPKASPPAKDQANGAGEAKKTELRFVNYSNPNDHKDREQMKLNRQHVMYTYLDKERLKPFGKRDVRVDGAGAAIKRKRSRIQMPTPFGTTLTANITQRRQGLPTPDASDREVESRETSSTVGSNGHGKKARLPSEPYSKPSEKPLVPGLNDTFDNSIYIKTPLQAIPWHHPTPADNPPSDPDTTLGATLNPFDTWPAFTDTSIDVTHLKWSCSRRFGSNGIALHWVPELLRARHAFLSTICISSAHDDIMARAHAVNATTEGHERILVRGEIIRMVSQSLGDPELRTADATIIAVLHLLNSEIMGCDDRVMKTHQDGLHRMVRQRGGLEGLGVRGQLARILTITMYIISILRESPPHREFVAYASKHAAPVPVDDRPLPESPVYCRPGGYKTITRANCGSMHTWDLLKTLRDFTKAFFDLHRLGPRPSPQTPSRGHSSANFRLDGLYTRIQALPTSTDPSLSFPDLNARNTYEALRLTGVLYTYALYHRIPFSVASAILSNTTTTSTTETLPLPLRIRHTLLRTDLSTVWGSLAGALFFTALITGAAANPGPHLANEERSGRDEEGRKVLAAIAVRCSIVLSFEFGEAVLESLRALAGIAAVVGSGGAGLEGLWTSEPGTGTFVQGRVVQGPEVPSAGAWTGMGHFAWEFGGLG